MKTSMKRSTLLVSILMVLLVKSAFGTSQDLTFHWKPCPTETPNGHACSPAVYYEVMVLTETEQASIKVNTVTDTMYTLRADPEVRYRVRVQGVDAQGRTSPYSDWSETVYLGRNTGVGQRQRAHLHSAFPNPFNPTTRIAYNVPSDLEGGAPVSLQIHDLKGRLVRSFDVDRTSGSHSVQWHGRDNQGQNVATGLYVARYVCGTYHQTTKLTLLK